MSAIRVDFYLLKTNDYQTRLHFICRLIEKIYFQHHKLFAYCQTQDLANELDETLWTFRPDCFIPHNLQGEGPFPPPPVQIGIEPPSKHFHNLLLNLTSCVPTFSTQFQRIIEVIYEDEQTKILGRERYRNYQSHGYTLHMHPIEDTLLKESTCDTA